MIKGIINRHKFFSGDYPFWIISDNILNALKELKFSYKSGSYLDKVLVINIDSRYDGDLSTDVFINHCYISLQLLVRFFKYKDLSKEFIYRYNVKEYHINIINRLYFNEYNSQISLDDKRPLGNSDIIGDIVSIINLTFFNNKFDYPTVTEKEKREYYFDIFYQSLDILTKLLSEQEIIFKKFVYTNFHDKTKLTKEQLKYIYNNWTLCKSEFREIKLNEILK